MVFVVFYFTNAEITNDAAPIGLGSIGALPVAFLVWAIGLGLGGTTGYAINPARDLGPRIAHAILPIKEKGSSAYRSFLIVRNDALKYPICIYRFSDTQYSALWMKCAHQGAELQASGDYLQCPAHGSEFNNKGQVTNGPASSNLRTFPVSVNNNEIFIDLRKQS